MLLILLSDLWLSTMRSDSCVLQRQLLAEVERYCATAAPSEQSSCRLVRKRLRDCEADDGKESLEVYYDEVSLNVLDHVSPCGLFLRFTKRHKGYRLDSFSKSKSICECDCCP